jgi:hypothetical protein
MPVPRALWYLAGAVVCAAAVPLAALTVPAYTGEVVGPGESRTERATIVDVNGMWSLVPASAPLLAAVAVALLLHRRCASGSAVALRTAWFLIAVLACFAVLASMSIGIWMAPATVLLALAAAATPGGGDDADGSPQRAPKPGGSPAGCGS